jgi:hypothetical protein
MKIVVVLLVLLTLILVSTASAFDIELSNTTDKRQYYRIKWLTCDWEGFGPVCHIGMGEMDPGHLNKWGADYKPGIYAVEWYNTADKYTETFPIEIGQRSGLLKLEFGKKPVFLPGV